VAKERHGAPLGYNFKKLYHWMKYFYEDCKMEKFAKILAKFQELYGIKLSKKHHESLVNVLESFNPAQDFRYDKALLARDSILICYGDSIQDEGQTPLHTLKFFLDQYVGEMISSVHLLPFFPFSSDDGFSVIDFYQVDQNLGNWDDIAQLSESFDLMFDAVINHISVESKWFKGFISGEEPYLDYFVTIDDNFDKSSVFRPRALPLITVFDTQEGPKRVWTTFSEDQVDLNYHNPEVLIDIVRILLMFIARGARFIRLDAIAYIWKESGTSCIHHENVHRIVQFFRLIFDALAPHVKIITETNVPHEQNISYFGDGTNEAQLVYNFTLPPLVLHAFHHKKTNVLTGWIKTLNTPTNQTHFFNFLASHDGIGVTPAKGWISEAEIDLLCERVKALGGFVSYKDNSDGSRSPYELNINFLDALGDPSTPSETDTKMAERFLASQSILLALKGLPGIYYHSLLGSRGWHGGVKETGRNRSINRQKLNYASLTRELSLEGSLRERVFSGYLDMLKARSFQSANAFTPHMPQTVLDVDERVFCLIRADADHPSRVLCITSVTDKIIHLDLEGELLKSEFLIDSQAIFSQNASFHWTAKALHLELGPYGILWLLLNAEVG
jgi:sucrose phosphorylase